MGKTDWAIHLAQNFQTEIISFDSRQFYREIPIGTAAPSAHELALANHHFIGHKSIFEAYTAGAFQEDALKKLRELFERYDHVILVGGSGMYLDAVTEGLDEFPEVNPGIRGGLELEFRERGLESLQKQLKALDPISFDAIDIQNPRRLIRALEVSVSSGKPYSSFLGKRKSPDFFSHLPLQITMERESLYERIGKRVQRMEAAGLEEEARKVYPHRKLPALQTVGYQELFRYFDGDWDKAYAMSEIAKNSRRYAKRQLTWLRKKAIDLKFEATQEKSLAIRAIETVIQNSIN